MAARRLLDVVYTERAHDAVLIRSLPVGEMALSMAVMMMRAGKSGRVREFVNQRGAVANIAVQ